MELEYTPEFTAILEHLHQGHGAFVTGLAGSGKSTLIREFCRTTNRNVIRAATTGVAALLIDGKTIHSLLGLSTTTTVHDVIDGSFQPRRRKVLKSMQTLIIDEASMLRADLFDTIIEILNRYGPNPGQWAGGVQLILVGDLYQLPPVVTDYEEEYFRTHYGSPFFFSAHHFSSTRTPTAKLTKVFRQIGDPVLADMLNAVREGLATERVRGLLTARTLEHFEPPDDEFWLTLATSNERARIINERRLHKLPDPPRTHTAVITGEVETREHPNAESIDYAVGAQIMLLTNDPYRRWVNGSMGVVTAINADGTIEIAVRGRTELVTVGPHTWEIVRPKVKNGRMTNKLVGTFTQLPFKLAWAITIHKSQGQTLDRIAIDLTGGAFAAGQTYVALSRATSLNGIVLTRPVRAKDLKVDPRIIRFLAEPDPFAATAPRCAIAVTTIGETFYADIPRIIEIGIAFSDGTALSTIVNPERDPGTALQDYGISNDDLLLAPTLPAAWAVMSQFLVGRTLIAADVDALTQVLAADLKRHGHAISLPIGTDAAVPDSYDQHTVIDRAFAALRTASAHPLDPAAQRFTNPPLDIAGYLLTRDNRFAPPAASRPTAAAALAASLAVSNVAFGAHPVHTLPADLAHTIGKHLNQTLGRAGRLSPELSTRARNLEVLLQTTLVPDHDEATLTIDLLLSAGAGVCFTGSATTPDGRRYNRKDMEDIARQCGLRTLGSVTKKHCSALIAAQIGSQSGKAKDAIRLGIPIFSASEFLDWAAQSGAA